MAQSAPGPVPPPPELTQGAVSGLTAILVNVSSPDNELRKAAEASLNDDWLLKSPAVLLSGLAAIARSHDQPQIRSMAAILLRRLALRPASSTAESNATFWMAMGSEARAYCEAELLASLLGETEAPVLKKLCDTVGELSRAMLAKGGAWPELLGTILQASASPNPVHRESAFRIIASVPALITGHSVTAANTAFLAALADENVDVRLSGLRAAVAYLTESSPEERAQCAALIPAMLNVLPPLLADTNDAELCSGLDDLINLAEAFPKLFRSVFSSLVQFSVGLLKTSALEDSTRQKALELLLTLAEAAPAMCRKLPTFCSSIIPICLEWMTQVQDEKEWHTADVLEEEESDNNAVMGEQAMDRLARALGGKVVLPVSFSFTPALLGNADSWAHRHAGLMAISSIAEGCTKIMEAELPKILDLVIPYLRDPHPRVRYAACNAIGQMCSDFAPKCQRLYGDKILSALIPVMSDQSSSRVQAHSAAAMVNFLEDARKQDVAPYLDEILEKLMFLLGTGKMYVQEQALTTIATVADSVQAKFVKYYDAIMPLLINILRSATGTEFRLLRAKSLECATLIAVAVGREKFGPSAAEFIGLMMEIQGAITEDDDPQSSYLLSAWARVCKVLGQDFVPYLDVVMPPLLTSAQIKPEFVVLDSEDVPGDEYNEEDGWQFIPIEGQNVGINTAYLEDKCTAVEMLVCYARALGPGFLPFAGQVLELAIPMLKFWYHDGVRQAAAHLVPCLFQCFVQANAFANNRPGLLDVWWKAADKILEVLDVDADPDFAFQLYVCFYESMEWIGDESLNADLLKHYTTTTKTQLDDYIKRVMDREELRNDADHDAEEEEIIQSEGANDDALMSELSRCMHEVFKAHRSTFLPYFEQLIPTIDQYLHSSDLSAKLWAVCCYDDLIEFAGPASFAYESHFLSAFSGLLVHPEASIRQPVAYGLGMMAQYGGPAYYPFLHSAVPTLCQLIADPAGRAGDVASAAENAVSALARMFMYTDDALWSAGGPGATKEATLRLWFDQGLPILEDESEGPIVYGYLMQLIASDHPITRTAADGTSNVPRMVQVFTLALASEVFDPAHHAALPELKDLAQQMVGYLRRLLGGVDEQTRGRLWNGIVPEHRATLEERGFL